MIWTRCSGHFFVFWGTAFTLITLCFQTNSNGKKEKDYFFSFDMTGMQMWSRYLSISARICSPMVASPSVSDLIALVGLYKTLLYYEAPWHLDWWNIVLGSGFFFSLSLIRRIVFKLSSYNKFLFQQIGIPGIDFCLGKSEWLKEAEGLFFLYSYT